MSYMIALNDFSSRASSALLKYDFSGKPTWYVNPKQEYTTMYYVKVIPELSLLSKSAIRKIESFNNLKDNWDSYGAEKPTKISIELAIQFIRKMDRIGLEVYFTAPGRNGDVLVELKLSEKKSAEIYFKSDRSNELLIFEDSECLLEGTIDNNYHELLKYNYGF